MKPDEKFFRRLSRELDGELGDPDRSELYEELRDDAERRLVAADWRKLSNLMRSESPAVPGRDLVAGARAALSSGTSPGLGPVRILGGELVPALRWCAAAAAVLTLIGILLVNQGVSSKIYAGSNDDYDSTIRSLMEGDAERAVQSLSPPSISADAMREFEEAESDKVSPGSSEERSDNR